MLVEGWRLAETLRRRRFRAGALDLDFPEVKVVLDAEGRVVELRRVEHDASHQLIEEFMLAANGAVAVAIREAAVPCLHRVHDEPDAERLWEFRELARSYGIASGDPTERANLQALLRRVRGKPEEHALKLALLKSLKRAAYAAESRGHYGLATANYLHFTSPIRRYADLVVHRILGRLPCHQPCIPARTPTHAVMGEWAAHLSATERVAADAEAESRQRKTIDYFEGLLLGSDPREFPAVVIEARRQGAFIELADIQVRGLVPVGLFPRGDWFYEGEQLRWHSMRPRGMIAAGTRMRVRIARVDRANGFLDFRAVE
jgi:ribonuclease R